MSGRRDESLVLDDLVQAATRLVEVAGSLPICRPFCPDFAVCEICSAERLTPNSARVVPDDGLCRHFSAGELGEQRHEVELVLEQHGVVGGDERQPS